MKKCLYCGRENEDSAASCTECGMEEFKDSDRADLLAKRWPRDWEFWLQDNFAHYRSLGEAQKNRLRNVSRVLIAEKTWEGCDGLELTEEMKLAIAAQAALLLLGLEHDYFGRVHSIVVFPKPFELPHESWQDENARGTVIAGQAVDYGSVYLSWSTVLSQMRNRAGGSNLVIHEFAHQLDFLDGYTNGTPVLRDGEQTRRWRQVMTAEFSRLRDDVRAGRQTFLGSYAATNDAEFFSVASERFFLLPARLKRLHPDLYEVLAEFYRVEPCEWFSEGDYILDGMDFIDARCPSCGRAISFPQAVAGQTKACPHCAAAVIVPEQPGQVADRVRIPFQTPRLRLRRLKSIDLEDLRQLLEDEDSLCALNWEKVDATQIEAWLEVEKQRRFPHDAAYGYLGIETLEKPRLIGLACIRFQETDCKQAEFSVLVHRDFRRQGYASEAVSGLLSFAFDGLRLHRLIAVCDSRNQAARGLLLKEGLRIEGEFVKNRLVNEEWINTTSFGLLKEEFDAWMARSR